MKKLLLIIGILFTLNSFGSVIIVKIDGGASGIVYMKGTSNPNAEAANITTALSGMGLTLQYGYKYTDANGNDYTYVNIGSGKWSKTKGDADAALDSVNCSTSGKVFFTQQSAGGTYKKVIIYLSAANGTATYNFPTPFVKTPGIFPSSVEFPSTISSLSTTAVTITAATQTGFIILEGY